MAYKQYTHCTPSSDYKKFDRDLWGKIVIMGGLTALITAIFVQAAIPGYGIYFVLFGSAAMLAGIIMVFEFLLGGKLICLGGDKLAIGKVISIELPGTKDGVIANIDNDYSINMLLCPHDMKFTTGDTEESTKENWDNVLKLADINPADPLNFQDNLVVEQNASSVHGVPYTNYETEPYKKKPNFHIELEGARIANMYAAFLAAWALLVAAAAAALAVVNIPGIGWLLAILIMLFGAAIAGGIAAITYAASSDGSLDDVDPTIGVLHAGDLIISYGTWTYDSGHNYDMKAGWNELHPVKFLSKGNILTTDAEGFQIEVPTAACLLVDQANEWQKKIEESLSMPDLTKEPGKDPLIGTSWHPLIDGCTPDNNNQEIIK